MELVQRVLWPNQEFAFLFDEFVVRDCRVRFHGGHIDVQALSDEANPAAVLTDYAEALRRLRPGYTRLLTVDEWGTLQPAVISNLGHPRRDPVRQRDQLGQARRDIVAPVHPHLSQCYDYFQKAVDDQEHVLFHLYKMTETIVEEYGGERKAVEALGSDLLKALKQLANDTRPGISRDQRHAPKSPGTGVPLTENEQARALEDGRTLLRRFEELQFSPPAGAS